jgi:hypothetical protein
MCSFRYRPLTNPPAIVEPVDAQRSVVEHLESDLESDLDGRPRPQREQNPRQKNPHKTIPRQKPQ